jgi:hypothetical protein
VTPPPNPADSPQPPGYPAAQVEILAQFLQLLTPGSPVLDVGLGREETWPWLRRQAAENGAWEPPLEAGSLADLPTGEIYAGALCLQALDDLPGADRPRVLVGLWNALRPGGLLYASLAGSLPAPDLAEQLRAAGFRLLARQSSAGQEHYLALKRRLPTNQLDFEVDTRAGSQSP